VPLNTRRMALVRLLQKDTDESARSHNASVQNINNVIYQSQDASDTNNNGNNRTSVLTELVSKLSSTVQTLQQSVTLLNNRVNVISRNVIPSEIENVTSDIPTSCIRSQGQSTLSQTQSSSPSEVAYSLQTVYNAMEANPSSVRNRPTAAAGSKAQARDIARGQYVRTALWFFCGVIATS